LVLLRVVQPAEILSRFPERLAAGIPSRGRVFERRPGCAVHGRPTGATAPGSIFTLNDGEIAVYADPPPASELNRGGIRLTAIYSSDATGPVLVPSGHIFARFHEDIRAEEQTQLLATAGFEIAERLSYAAHAVWLRARSGDAADALHQFPLLGEIGGIESVEPQMLMGRSFR
jgi:hypothetical protein